MHAWTALIAFCAVLLAFVPAAVSASLFLMGVIGLAIAVFWPTTKDNTTAAV
jgi:hypothetical protein